MATLIYPPAIQLLIHTDAHGTLDVSDDVSSGSVTLNINTEHQLRVQLENARRKYDGVFTPNDRFVLRLKRTHWLPIMAGYLDRVPMASAWPSQVNLHGSCTLKRIKYTLFDRGAQASMDLLNTAGSQWEPDGGYGQVATDLLEHVAQWDRRAIHMAKIPDQWHSSISALYGKIAPSLDYSALNEEAVALIPQDVIATISGEEAASISGEVGGIPQNPSIMGPPTVSSRQMVAWYRSKGRPEPTGFTLEAIALAYERFGKAEGVRGDLAFVQAVHETGNFTNPGARRDNNFAGIAHHDNRSRGRAFPTMQDGVLAHIQLLKKAASGNGVQFAMPDKLGIDWGGTPAPYLNNMTRNWASDPNYDRAVGGMFTDMLAFSGKTELNNPAPKVQDRGAQGVGSMWGAGSSSPPASSSEAPGIGGSAGIGFGTGVGNAGNTPVFPIPGKSVADVGSKFGRRLHPTRGGYRMHNGVDIGAPRNTPVVSTTSGTVVRARDGQPEGRGLGRGSGNDVVIRDDSGNTHHYFHLQNGTVAVSAGQVVRAGQQIGGVGSTGESTGPHLHYEYHPGGGAAADPLPFLNGTTSLDEAIAGAGVPGASMSPMPIITPSEDVQAQVFTGPRALMNDEGLLRKITELLSSTHRDFCSAPNGDFIAWFPDYFNHFDVLGSITLEPIEMLDFSIDWDDRMMKTHQFVTGSLIGYGAAEHSLIRRVLTHGVVSVEFPEILEALIGEIPGEWDDPTAILERFGARVANLQSVAYLSPIAEFFLAVHEFTKSWAAQFSTIMPISFMPELWPGMHLKVPSQGIQVYVEQVTHSWNMTDGQGFETTAAVMAPASIDGRHSGLPRVGSLKNVAAESSPPVEKAVPDDTSDLADVFDFLWP